MKYCEVNAYYLDVVTMGKAYVHFFSKDVAEKVYNSIKNFPSQYQDCELRILQKKEDEDYFKKIYSYLKDQNYLNYAYEPREANFVQWSEENSGKTAEKNEGEKSSELKETKVKQDRAVIDEDGFVIVKNKKKINN